VWLACLCDFGWRFSNYESMNDASHISRPVPDFRFGR
jgi:hypothetical protein